MGVLFAPLAWTAGDVQPEDGPPKHMITAFGRLLDGRSCCLHLPWLPRFFVKVTGMTGSERQRLLDQFPNREPQLSRLVKRMNLYGFHNGQQDSFLRLVFWNRTDYSHAKWRIQNYLKKETFEAQVQTAAQFMHEADIRPAAWLQFHGQQVMRASRVARTDVEYELTSHTRISQAQDPPTAPVPWCIASWDLEVYSPDDRFPTASDEACPIIQIGVVFARFRSPIHRRVVITTTPCDPVAGVEVIEADGEAQAILIFAGILVAEQADILVAWNGFGFDNNYLFVRATLNDIDEALNFSKLINHTLTLDSKNIKGRDVSLFTVPGVLQFDPMAHLRGENRFAKYSLNFVAGETVNEHKLDMPATQLFHLHRTGGSAGQAQIAEYCARDCDLPILILERLALLPAVLALANATRTTPDQVLTRGQGIRVFNQLLFKAHQLGYLVPDLEKKEPTGEKFSGAVVLEPTVGTHEQPVMCLDYASLYPR